jgi:hypothetical protein
LAGAYKEITRTANHPAVNNTSYLSSSASAAFGDRLTFTGSGTSFSFTVTPDVLLATADLGFDFGEGQPPLASVERNFRFIESEVLINYEVRNANNTVAYTINQGAYERLDSSGLFRSRGRYADHTFQDIAPVDFTLSAGQTLVISGSVFAMVDVFSSIDTGKGAADAAAGLKLYLDGITAGWDYMTYSGDRLPVSAIPEPSSFALLCGLAALGLVARRRAGTGAPERFFRDAQRVLRNKARLLGAGPCFSSGRERAPGGSRAGVQIHAGTSGNLASDSWTRTNVQEVILSTVDGVETVEASVPISPSAPQFLRIRVTYP